MSFGYLHFNLYNCLKADVLNQSLSNLIGSHAHVSDFFKRLKLDLENVGALDFFWNQKNSGDDLKNFFEKLKLDPLDDALALKIIDTIFCGSFNDEKVSQENAFFMCMQILTFLAHLKKLNPQFISCSSIPNNEHVSSLPIHEKIWVNHTLLQMPTKKSSQQVLLDVLGIALIKAVCSHFGSMMDGVSLSMGIGNIENWVIEVLWSKAHMPNTIGSKSSLSVPKEQESFLVCGMIGLETDIKTLFKKLIRLEASDIFYHHVFDNNSSQKIRLSFVTKQKYKNDALKEFFKHAHHICLTSTTNLSLTKTIAALPVGIGNKKSICRFYEHMYLDEIIKVEPVLEDLVKYAHELDESLDIARLHLMSVYKKWRNEKKI